MKIKRHFYKLSIIKSWDGSRWEIELLSLSITPIVLILYIYEELELGDVDVNLPFFKRLPLEVCPHCYLRKKCQKYTAIRQSPHACCFSTIKDVVLNPLLKLDRQGVKEGDTLRLAVRFPYCSQSYDYYLKELSLQDGGRRFVTCKVKLLDIDVFEIYVDPGVYCPSWLINRLKSDGVISDNLLNNTKYHSRCRFCMKLKNGRVIPAETDIPYSELGFADDDTIEIIISDNWGTV